MHWIPYWTYLGKGSVNKTFGGTCSLLEPTAHYIHPGIYDYRMFADIKIGLADPKAPE